VAVNDEKSLRDWNSQRVVTRVAPTTALDNVTVNKNYGTNDAALAALTSTTGLVTGTTVTDWNGASTTINDAVSLATLQRNPGENAGNYAITNGTLALTGTLNGANNPAVASNYTTTCSTTQSRIPSNPLARTT